MQVPAQTQTKSQASAPILASLVALIVLFALAISAAHAEPSHAHGAPSGAMSDRPAIHGMVVFGQSQIFISHLPMTHSPHNYHAIFEIELPAPAAQGYLKSKAQDPDALFTLVPEPFVLPDLAANPHAIKATLYLGHFEQGGTPVARDLMVKVKRVVFFEQI